MLVKLKPALGLIVRTPQGDRLPVNGASVELNTYWQRRINDGDVEQVKEDKIPVSVEPIKQKLKERK